MRNNRNSTATAVTGGKQQYSMKSSSRSRIVNSQVCAIRFLARIERDRERAGVRRPAVGATGPGML
jgi:hypothetical protein